MKFKKLGIGKTIFLAVLVAFIVFSIIRLYHYSVLKRISDAGKEFIESENYNYIARTVRKNTEEIVKQYRNGNKMYHHLYYKDSDINYEANEYSVKVLDEEFLNVYYASDRDDSLVICTHSEESFYDSTRPVNFSTYWMLDSNSIYIDTYGLFSKISNWIHYKIMYPAVFEREYDGRMCYVYNKFATVRHWIDKETLLPVKEEYLENDGQVYQTTYYEYNKLSDKVIDLPNPKDYKTVEYIDSGKQLENSWKKTAEEPISGTNLKPDEMLCENIEIKDNETLNFLELTPNEDGIVSLNIYSYETYNKFRTRYSNLRELTEKDFERYFVSIAFKEGYKLNYLERWESSQANITNIIMNTEKTDKKNLVLLVLPKATGNMRTEYVENTKKIKIDSYTAVDNIQKYLDDFSKEYDLENMDFMGYNNDFICRLTNKKFAELDYIINPVKGEEPICWSIDWCVYRGDVDAQFNDLTIYIDATTGEVIGSKADY